MNKNMKTLSETIEMATKGFIPLRNSFIFEGNIFEAHLVNKSKSSWLYDNKDGTSYIEFRYDEADNLISAGLSLLQSDEDTKIIYHNQWTEEQKRKAFCELK